MATPPRSFGRARALRRDATSAEQQLWRLLRSRQFAGLKFRRQHPLGPFVLDFYCAKARLAIELDGGQHNEAAAIAADARRSEWLRAQGVRVLRFWNNDVLANPEGVLTLIAQALDEPHPRPHG